VAPKFHPLKLRLLGRSKCDYWAKRCRRSDRNFSGRCSCIFNYFWSP